MVDWLHDVAATDGADDGKLDALDFSTQSDIYSETSDFIKEMVAWAKPRRGR